MGHRLSKIYTRTGDDGTTGLGDGQRVSKDDLRVEAYGTVDETNSAIGLLRAHLNQGLAQPHDLDAALSRIQHELFDLGGELCIPNYRILQPQCVERLEQVAAMNAQIPPLRSFVLPGGTPAAAFAHLARPKPARAERLVVAMVRAEEVNPAAIRYLCRLSDHLFVLSRRLNGNGAGDVTWVPGASR